MAICPIMSRPQFKRGPEEGDGSGVIAEESFVPCQEYKCKLWINTYTTENEPHQGCSIELGPQMVNGLFKV